MTSVTWLTPPSPLAPDAPVLVLVTWPDDRDPAPFVRALVDDRLVACGTVLPAMRSIYRWEDTVREDAERQMVLKTTAARVDALQLRVGTLHPYDVPEFLVISAEAASAAYLSWLRDAVAPGRPRQEPPDPDPVPGR